MVEKVIHTKKQEKCRKMGISTKLSTLSTPKVGERTFCRLVIKMTFCRKKKEFVLTFK